MNKTTKYNYFAKEKVFGKIFFCETFFGQFLLSEISFFRKFFSEFFCWTLVFQWKYLWEKKNRAKKCLVNIFFSKVFFAKIIFGKNLFVQEKFWPQIFCCNIFGKVFFQKRIFGKNFLFHDFFYFLQNIYSFSKKCMAECHCDCWYMFKIIPGTYL